MIVSGTPNFPLTFWTFSKNGAEFFLSLGHSPAKSTSPSSHARLPRAVESSSARIFIAVIKKGYDPLTFRSYLEKNPAGMSSNQIRKAIGPFDYANAVAKKIVVETKPVG